MKTVRTQPKYFFITIQGLFLLYLLLCILTVLFSRSFFNETLQEGGMPGVLTRIVIFTIPGVLLIFLAFSVISLIRDILENRTGSKFQTRLLGYFIITVILSTVPLTIITTQSVYELLRFWRTVNINSTLQYAQNTALENYALNLERFEQVVQETDFDALMSGRTLPETLASIQDFVTNEEGGWEAAAFRGDPGRELQFPPGGASLEIPGTQRGFVSRELPRDIDTVRYILFPARNMVRLLSFDLGSGFDAAIEAIDNERARFELIDSLVSNIRPLVFY
jgi:hypothetical protein